jgi:putative copper export protein/mono/diheme cytochrome c family protein
MYHSVSLAGIDILGLLVRWIHLACSVLLVGGCGMFVIAGPSDRPTALRWQARMSATCRALAMTAVVSGIGALAHQTAVLEGRPAAAIEWQSVARVLLETQSGTVWLARHGLLLILATFLAMGGDLSRRLDWRAARWQALVLAAAALALISAAAHAAAVEPSAAGAITADVVHLLAAGIWAGGLLHLASLLHATAGAAGADARPYAVLAARRFSALALVLVAIVAVSGAVSTLIEVGTIAGLIGTRHGRLLIVKLFLVALMLALAARNRRVMPALSGEAATTGWPAMRRLRASVLAEGVAGLVVLIIVAAMTATPPGRHEQPTWPLTFRLSWDAAAEAPALRPLVLVGSQIAALGAAAAIASLALARLRLPVLAGGAVTLMAGLALAIPPLVTDAYPTTYQRPAIAYSAASIASGAALYRAHCTACHGPRGAGDGPAAQALDPRPSDLRAHHAALHTAGDLFWWISHGRRAMPAFADRVDPDGRWDLVNFVRALGAAETARTLTQTVEPERPRVVAPDFSFTVGPTPARTLREYRGRRVVLVVLYTLPVSADRLTELAERYDVMVPLGAEIIAVPTDAAPDAIKRLARMARALFPVVTGGAAEIVAAYSLFAAGPHAEFLVDRQGYLRAQATGAFETGRLLSNIQTLNEEKVVAPPPSEHVH